MGDLIPVLVLWWHLGKEVSVRNLQWPSLGACMSVKSFTFVCLTPSECANVCLSLSPGVKVGFGMLGNPKIGCKGTIWVKELLVKLWSADPSCYPDLWLSVGSTRHKQMFHEPWLIFQYDKHCEANIKGRIQWVNLISIFTLNINRFLLPFDVT